MAENNDRLFTLALVASQVFDAMSSASSDDGVTSALQDQASDLPTPQCKTKTRNGIVKQLRERPALSSRQSASSSRQPALNYRQFCEDTSDELSKKFSFKCKIGVCSEVTESYGSEDMAYRKMVKHLTEHHRLEDLRACASQSTKPETSKSFTRMKPVNKLQCGAEAADHLEKPPKKASTVKPVKTTSDVTSSDMMLVGETMKREMENIIILQSGDVEHNYASSNATPAQEKKKRKQKSVVTEDFHLEAYLKRPNPYAGRTIGVPPFPFVYVPESFVVEAQIIELNANGDPVHFEPAADGIASKSVDDNKRLKKKTKLDLPANSHRSVLECVENRVACKSNTSFEQKDSIIPDDNVENTENVSKDKVYEIAMKNIQLLTQQRKKRRNCEKPKTFVCQICSKILTAYTSLTHHYMSHLNIKLFKCTVCKREFTRSHSLKYHMMTHDNKHRFQCEICKHRFRHPSHYREHIRKHTGEAPFACELCPDKFRTRNSFKRHMEKQHQKLLTSSGIESISNDNLNK